MASTPSNAGTASNAGFAVGTSQDQAAIGLLVSQLGSAMWSQWQIVRYSFYDYVRMANGAASTAQLTFFSVPLGGADPVSGLAKTSEQTNMPQQGQFGQQYFIVQQIRTHLSVLPKARQNATVAATTTYTYDQEVVMAAYKSALGQGVLNFTIQQKGYFDIQQPFRTAPPGFGLTQVVVPYDYVVANAASVSSNVYTAQSNALDDVWNLTPPQLIEPSTQFQCVIQFPQLGYNWHNTLDAAAQNANVDAGVILDGYLCRPLQ